MAEQNNQGMNPNLLQGLVDAIAGGALAGLSLEAQQDFLSPFLKAQQTREAQKLETQRRAEDLAIRKQERAEDKAFRKEEAIAGREFTTAERLESQAFQLGRDKAAEDFAREEQLRKEEKERNDKAYARVFDLIRTMPDALKGSPPEDVETFVSLIPFDQINDPTQLATLSALVDANRRTLNESRGQQDKIDANGFIARGELDMGFVNLVDTSAAAQEAVSEYVIADNGLVKQRLHEITAARVKAQGLREKSGLELDPFTDPNIQFFLRAYDNYDKNRMSGMAAQQLLTALNNVPEGFITTEFESASTNAQLERGVGEVGIIFEDRPATPLDLIPGVERFDFTDKDLYQLNEGSDKQEFAFRLKSDSADAFAQNLYYDYGFNGAIVKLEALKESGFKIPQKVDTEISRAHIRATQSDGLPTATESSVLLNRILSKDKLPTNPRELKIRELIENPKLSESGAKELITYIFAPQVGILNARISELDSQIAAFERQPATPNRDENIASLTALRDKDSLMLDSIEGKNNSVGASAEVLVDMMSLVLGKEGDVEIEDIQALEAKHSLDDEAATDVEDGYKTELRSEQSARDALEYLVNNFAYSTTISGRGGEAEAAERRLVFNELAAGLLELIPEDQTRAQFSKESPFAGLAAGRFAEPLGVEDTEAANRLFKAARAMYRGVGGNLTTLRKDPDYQSALTEYTQITGKASFPPFE